MSAAPVRTELDGRLLPLPRADVDTDQIMPQTFLKRLEKTGFGEFAFHNWRQDPAFELNQPRYAGATILVAGANFGCGSSREQAVWGLVQYGFAAIVAPSFGPIFRSNCSRNGLLALAVAEADVARLTRLATDRPDASAHVDVAAGTVTAAGEEFAFELDAIAREMWTHDLDEIALTLQLDDEIERVAARRPEWMPRIRKEPTTR